MYMFASIQKPPATLVQHHGNGQTHLTHLAHNASRTEFQFDEMPKVPFTHIPLDDEA